MSFQCNECNKYYSTKGHLTRHLWEIHDVGYGHIHNCHILKCDFSTKNKGSLKTHLWEIHNIGKGDIYNCKIEGCGYTTKNKGRLKRHLWEIHNIGNGIIHNCDVESCNYTTKDKGNWKKHLWEVHNVGKGNIHKCKIEECNYTTKNKGSLKRHLWSIHNVGKGDIHKCKIDGCDFSTKNKGSLKTHLWVVHNVGQGHIFNCDVEECNYTTKRKDHLKLHLENVHDVGDLVCEYCLGNCFRLIEYNDKNVKKKVRICRKCYNKVTGFSSRPEQQMVEYLKTIDTISPYIVLTDQILKHDSCSTRRRPDVLISSGDLHIIVECDEKQHEGYNVRCELGRMDEIIDEFQKGKIVFIRWNPDFYVPKNGVREKRKDRLNKLKDMISDIIHSPPSSHISVIYMYYSEENEIITSLLHNYKRGWNIQVR